MTTFTSEAQFEQALIDELKNKGWDSQVLKNPTEADLLKNWAQILFQNNRGINRLNNVPLTDSEMQQIIEQIQELRTPLKLNGFINGKTVAIKRDNPADPMHLGKEISLKIYDRQEIAAGQSRYQIVQQPRFAKTDPMLQNRRGDLMLLINGMPVIHIELKRSGVPVSHACNQIEKYSAEGLFSGLFSLVQIFVAMQPQEMVYFANPGADGLFNRDFYFHWADVNNEPMNRWQDIAARFLSIPMAHQLIGFYTVADSNDGVLKVMRSYQYYAANAIADKVAKHDWSSCNQLGGHVWHTTGSGKTMTSFKSAQLIAQSGDADKVVFLMDRIELGTQSLLEYRGFADDSESVQATENTGILVSKLKSSNPSDTLIVSSIQKLSNIKQEASAEGVGLQSHDIERINQKRLVFIIDEAHRSTFGDMLIDIKATFPRALFFGFTGTPIHDENQRKNNTTAMLLGDELHRYSIADGIRDKNVLGFDPYQVLTFKDRDVRREVALLKAKANTESEALADAKKSQVYNRYMREVAMAGHTDAKGNYIKGIEDEIPPTQYAGEQHQKAVVQDILDSFTYLSQNGKFHAIFATSSIPEAIQYYRRIRQAAPELKITALFDPHINEGDSFADGGQFKQNGLIEILEDYNALYEKGFKLDEHAAFKRDLAARLGHKKPYLRLKPEQQLDVLIVVDQMLTGFDSKWLNTLYLDKLMRYENIIQAFSRTNRLYKEHEKPFGIIRYYRYPHSMLRNIEAAVKLYSGDKPLGLFVDKLPENVANMQRIYSEIVELFTKADEPDFEKLPQDSSVCGQFAKLFSQLNKYLESAKVQGFTWQHPELQQTTDGISESSYLILAIRYKELASSGSGGGSGGNDDVPFNLEGHLTEIDTDKIDADYMNSRFDKFLRVIQQDGADPQEVQVTLDELHKTFATLGKTQQKYANIFLNDVQRGDILPEPGKTFRDYISQYMANAKYEEISELAHTLAEVQCAYSFEEQLIQIMNTAVTSANINEFGRFDKLKQQVDMAKAKAHFEKLEGKPLSDFQVRMKIDQMLKGFISRSDLAE